MYAQADARHLPVRPDSFDVAISLCQGAFGLLGGPGSGVDEDLDVLREMVAAVRPGGRIVLSAFSSYFQVRHLDDVGQFDADAGVQHEHTEVRDEDGRAIPVELWTTCFTPRELRLMVGDRGCTAWTGCGRSSPAATDETLLVSSSPSSW